MILIIDNYDSFTWNLVQQLEALGAETQVIHNDKITPDDITENPPQAIIISPGPKTPDSAGVSCDIVRRFYREIPILGVCLGHQCIARVFGQKVIQAKEIIHGQALPVYHDAAGIFSGIPSPFSAARYHSLGIKSVPDEFFFTAWSKDREIMAMAHKKYPVFGVQFHPESFLTEFGDHLLRNFLHAI